MVGVTNLSHVYHQFSQQQLSIKLMTFNNQIVTSNYNHRPIRSWSKLNHPTIGERQKDLLLSPELPLMPNALLLFSISKYRTNILLIALSLVPLWVFHLWFFYNLLPSLNSITFFQLELSNANLIHSSIESCLTPMNIIHLNFINLEWSNSNAPHPNLSNSPAHVLNMECYDSNALNVELPNSSAHVVNLELSNSSPSIFNWELSRSHHTLLTHCQIWLEYSFIHQYFQLHYNEVCLLFVWVGVGRLSYDSHICMGIWVALTTRLKCFKWFIYICYKYSFWIQTCIF